MNPPSQTPSYPYLSVEEMTMACIFSLSKLHMPGVAWMIRLAIIVFPIFSPAAIALAAQPVTYIFGDSLTDVGNNNFLQYSITKSNYPCLAGCNDHVNNFLQPFLADGQRYTHGEFIELLISTLDQQLQTQALVVYACQTQSCAATVMSLYFGMPSTLQIQPTLILQPPPSVAVAVYGHHHMSSNHFVGGFYVAEHVFLETSIDPNHLDTESTVCLQKQPPQ
ncbi:hypothetical protein VNO77_32202 [Canavalia gladiata]|uniref:Uncharacterized protein n=1 Tax=Canavalia gladiata TaxID=3824 RepID=A0AAN9KQH6_CANGL